MKINRLCILGIIALCLNSSTVIAIDNPPDCWVCGSEKECVQAGDFSGEIDVTKCVKKNGLFCINARNISYSGSTVRRRTYRQRRSVCGDCGSFTSDDFDISEKVKYRGEVTFDGKTHYFTGARYCFRPDKVETIYYTLRVYIDDVCYKQGPYLSGQLSVCPDNYYNCTDRGEISRGEITGQDYACIGPGETVTLHFEAEDWYDVRGGEGYYVSYYCQSGECESSSEYQQWSATRLLYAWEITHTAPDGTITKVASRGFLPDPTADYTADEPGEYLCEYEIVADRPCSPVETASFTTEVLPLEIYMKPAFGVDATDDGPNEVQYDATDFTIYDPDVVYTWSLQGVASFADGEPTEQPYVRIIDQKEASTEHNYDQVEVVVSSDMFNCSVLSNFTVIMLDIDIGVEESYEESEGKYFCMDDPASVYPFTVSVSPDLPSEYGDAEIEITATHLENIYEDEDKNTPAASSYTLSEFDENQTLTLYLDVDAFDDGTITAEMTHNLMACSAEDKVAYGFVGVNVDGPNIFGKGSYDDDEEEYPGSYVVYNDDDDSPTDGDHTLDYDNSPSEKSSDARILKLQDASVLPGPQPGYISITPIGNIAVYEGSSLNSLAPSYNAQTVLPDFYIEGIGEDVSMRDSGVMIEYANSDWGVTCYDIVNISVVSVNLRGDSNNDGNIDINDDRVEEDEEHSVYINLNSNDSDDNEEVDNINTITDGPEDIEELTDLEIVSLLPNDLPQGKLIFEGADNTRIFALQESTWTMVKPSALDGNQPVDLFTINSDVTQIPLKIEGVEEGVYDLSLVYKYPAEEEYTTFSDKIKIEVMRLDMSVDSDNSESDCYVCGDEDDDPIEDIADEPDEYPGKVIQVNSVDKDWDGLPDWADGATDILADQIDSKASNPYEKFVPICFTLPADVELDKAKVRFIFKEGGITVTRTGLDSFSQPSGIIRLWKKMGDETRNAAVDAIVAEQVYTAEEIFDTHSVTLYAEAVTNSQEMGDINIRCEMNPEPSATGGEENFVIFDEVHVSAVYMSPIYNTDKEKCVIFPGETAHLAVDMLPVQRSLQWQILKTSTGVIASVNNGLLTVYENSKSGYVVVEASDEEWPDCLRRISVLKVGCPCHVESCPPGSGIVQLSSIDMEFSLGPTLFGNQAAVLFIQTDDPGYALNPENFMIATASRHVREKRSLDGTHRQIRTDLIVTDMQNAGNVLAINFYHLSDITDLSSSGMYDVESAAPFKTWTMTLSAGNMLQVDEADHGVTIAQSIYEKTVDGWILRRAPGSDDEAVTMIVNSTDTSGNNVETKTIENPGEEVFYKEISTYNEFSWGEEVVQTVIDPDGSDPLVTQYSYYDAPSEVGKHGKIESIDYPDGSWVHYDYNEDGMVTSKLLPWNDVDKATAVNNPSTTREITYSYSPLTGDDGAAQDARKPRTVTEYAAGNMVSREWHVYFTNVTTGVKTEITEKAADATSNYGDSDNLKTIRKYYAYNVYSADSKRLKSIEYPDGRTTSYAYTFGTFTLTPPADGSFVTGATNDIQTIITHGSTASPDGMANKTTREVTYETAYGVPRLKRTEVYNGSGYELLSWESYVADGQGRIIQTKNSNNEQIDTTWACCGLDSRTDQNGIETIYIRDDLKRVISTERAGITETSTFDPAGNRLTQSRAGGALTLTSSSTYDLAGRMTSSTDEAELVTVYSTVNGGRINKEILPGGATQITTNYMDGRTKSVTGSAVVHRYYEYGVNGDGSQWTKVYTGPDGLTSPVWEKTTTDMLGRTVKIEKPAYGGGAAVTEYFYNNQGQLTEMTQTGMADLLYAYDELGNQVRNGHDVNDNGALDLSSMDRINDSETEYEKDGSSWWRKTTSKVYAKDNDSAVTTVSIQKQRISDYPTDAISGLGKLTSEIRTYDIHGHATTNLNYIDRENVKATQVVWYPDSTNEAMNISVNGLLQSSESKTGVEHTYGYDALNRQISAETQSGGNRLVGSYTFYNSKGQVEATEDAAGHRTEYVYDLATGRRIETINSLDDSTYYAYDDRGNLTNTWGATYPVAYVFDAYNRMIQMKTWQDEFDTPVITHWIFDEATGLLESKEYADGNGPTYAYDSAGRLTQRTWARGVVTDYDYDSLGQLTAVDYSDATPSVTYTYDRLGRRLTADVDGGSSTTYQYDPDSLLLIQEGSSLIRSYDDLGRSSRITYGTDYRVDYSYDTVGRHSVVSSRINNVSASFYYTYIPGSDIISGYTNASGLAVERAYELSRNLILAITNRYNTTGISQYNYENNAIGHRVKREDLLLSAGLVYTNDYYYNPKGELTKATRWTAPNYSNSYTYGYDDIGNRWSVDYERWDNQDYGYRVDLFFPNELNQYEETTWMDLLDDPGLGNHEFYFDADGNMTNDAQYAYVYDGENRLISVYTPLPEPAPGAGSGLVNPIIVSFSYDHQGRRISKTSSWGLSLCSEMIEIDGPDGKTNVYVYSWDWNDGEGISFVYDNWNVIRINRQQRNEGSCGTQTDEEPPYILYHPVWGLDLSGTMQGAGGVGGLLWLKREMGIDGGEPDETHNYCYMADANGNITDVIDMDVWTSAARYDYDAYGEAIDISGAYANENPFRFSTKYFDTEMELYYYGYRFYSPRLGRWPSRDPIGIRGGKNLYAAYKNNPIDAWDYLGLKTCKIIFWIGHARQVGDELRSSASSSEDPPIRHLAIMCGDPSLDTAEIPNYNLLPKDYWASKQPKIDIFLGGRYPPYCGTIGARSCWSTEYGVGYHGSETLNQSETVRQYDKPGMTWIDFQNILVRTAWNAAHSEATTLCNDKSLCCTKIIIEQITKPGYKSVFPKATRDYNELIERTILREFKCRQ